MKYFILIFLFSINSLAFPNKNNDDAFKEAGDALGSILYKQYNGDFYTRNALELIINKKYWQYLTPAANIGKMIIERKVIFKYEF